MGPQQLIKLQPQRKLRLQLLILSIVHQLLFYCLFIFSPIGFACGCVIAPSVIQPPAELVSSFLPLARNHVFNYQPMLRATYRELKHFVMSPCPPGATARCYIERNRSGTKMLAPFYSICADLEGITRCSPLAGSCR